MLITYMKEQRKLKVEQEICMPVIAKAGEKKMGKIKVAFEDLRIIKTI